MVIGINQGGLMKEITWKVITMILSLLFLYELYDFTRLYSLNLIDTPIWLNLFNLVASVLLLIALASFSFNLKIFSPVICYSAIYSNILLLFITHYYEYNLGGYELNEMIFVFFINLFILTVISTTLIKYMMNSK